MKSPKGKSLTPKSVIKKFIWDGWGCLLQTTEEKFMASPLTLSERETYYLNRGKFFNSKSVS